MSGQPQVVWMPGGVRTEIHLTGADTGGAFCLLVDHPPAGWSLPAHIHEDAAETIHVIEGEFEMTIDGATVMIPVHNAPAFESPYIVAKPDALGRSQVSRDGAVIGEVKFQLRPRFYERSTADGIPYSKIATLHGRDVLATTILQSCIRYQSRTKTCQFCAIGQSLAAGRTIERKTPEQLGEVAKAAVELDGVTHMVMTTGTPPGIWTMESSESSPSRWASGTGTPITGSGVTDASMPGRWAAPPAPAMMTRMPRSAADAP